MDFPVYRKYKNNKSFFKVLGYDAFEEIQTIGKFYSIHHFTATIFPDRNFIYDMIGLHNGHWTEISEEEYTTFLEKCRQDYKKAGKSI